MTFEWLEHWIPVEQKGQQIEELGKNNIQLLENPESWVIKVEDLRVTQILIDYAFGLYIWKSDDFWISIRIEGVFSFTSNEGEFALDPEEGPTTMCPALTVFNQQIESITARKSGFLELVFSNGIKISAPPDPMYEAWTLNGPKGMILVCMPGGEVDVRKPILS